MINTTEPHLIKKIQQQNPLIVNLCNDVILNFVADGLLSLGASPIMTNSEDELEELIQLSQAVTINLGTLNNTFIKRCELACQLANNFKKPLILDPVGCGASHLRTQTAQRFFRQFQFSAIKANASEIIALYGQQTIQSKGVDSSNTTESALLAGRRLAEQYQTMIVISGKTDIIIEGENLTKNYHGHALMTQVCGMGCLLTATLATALAVNRNRFESAVTMVNYYTLCGEIAAQKATGPGSFKIAFLDALSGLKLG